jgi:hypothetical protein
MRRVFLGLAVMIWAAFSCTAAQAQDNGVPDTLYLEVFPGDQVAYMFPVDVRFNLRVTNDIPDPTIDSIAGFVIPLDFTSSNAAANAVIPASKNNTNVYPWPDLENSIFRHMPSMADPQERSWMMDLSEQMLEWVWDTRILDVGTGDHFWLSLVPTGWQDKRFPGGSRVLLATMTFTVEETTTICIDTCFPAMMRLAFSRSDAVTYTPQIWDDYIPADEVCQSIHFPGGLPHFTICPNDQTHSVNGDYSSAPFEATTLMRGEVVAEVDVSFAGSGVENASVFYTSPPPAEYVAGYVEYDVVDHCQIGGTMTLTARDEYGASGPDCDFDVVLTNSAPAISLPPTWRALAGYTMSLPVSALDANGDEITGMELDAFWYEDDSLQPPVNPPSFDGGNPGLFSWAPTETETGTWIALFSATDACDDSYSRDISIEVGTLYCGDCNADGEINLADVVYLVGDLFKEGPPPDPTCRGDSNCSGVRDVGDVVLLINYLFKYGQAPCFECCP